MKSSLVKSLAVLIALAIASLVFTSCGPSPAPETVIEPVTIKETVIVAGTPQVIEKIVTQIVEPTLEPVDKYGGTFTRTRKQSGLPNGFTSAISPISSKRSTTIP